jgi:hypothetical protein
LELHTLSTLYDVSSALSIFVIDKLTDLVISPADVEHPVMLWPDKDSIVRDILPMGQDPRSRAALHPVAVFVSADLSIPFPVILRPVLCPLLLDITGVRSAKHARGGETEKNTNIFLGLLVMLHDAIPSTSNT